MNTQFRQYLNEFAAEVRNGFSYVSSDFDQSKFLEIVTVAFACMAFLWSVKRYFFTAKVVSLQGKMIPFNEVVWKGETSETIFIGRGKVQLSDQTSYEGIFANGWLVEGTMTLKDCILKGSFRDGKLNGKGELSVIEDGFCYRGNFEEGALKGRGSVTDPEGNTFTGYWNGMDLSGNVDIVYADGTTGTWYF